MLIASFPPFWNMLFICIFSYLTSMISASPGWIYRGHMSPLLRVDGRYTTWNEGNGWWGFVSMNSWGTSYKNVASLRHMLLWTLRQTHFVTVLEPGEFPLVRQAYTYLIDLPDHINPWPMITMPDWSYTTKWSYKSLIVQTNTDPLFQRCVYLNEWMNEW